MKIESAAFGPFETNCYLLLDDDGIHCALIDAPPGSAAPILALIAKRGLKLDKLLLTHGHWDHMSDAHLYQKAGAVVYAHKADRHLIEQVESIADRYLDMIPWLKRENFVGCKVDHWLDEGDQVNAAGHAWQVRHVPGHCPGSLLFYSAEEKVAFSGDAIFEQSVGRTDLPGGDWAELLRSIREKIYTLPADTVLLPGHGEQTSVGAEIAGNPYARPA